MSKRPGFLPWRCCDPSGDRGARTVLWAEGICRGLGCGREGGGRQRHFLKVSQVSPALLT